MLHVHVDTSVMTSLRFRYNTLRSAMNASTNAVSYNAVPLMNASNIFLYDGFPYNLTGQCGAELLETSSLTNIKVTICT